MTVPTVPGARRPAPISGVVDGELVSEHDTEGNLCLHLMVCADPPYDGIQVEFVLSPEDARLLRRLLENGQGAANSLPCRIGIRLRRG
jgi:hypothetical protein